MYDRLKQKDEEPQIEILRRDGYFELVLLTLDCPGLFSHVVGTLSSWGMNILKAEAFANKAGVVLDTFRFSDRFRTLELNPSEINRLKRKLAEAVSGEINVVDLMETKFKPGVQNPKVKIETSVQTDNTLFATQHPDRDHCPGPSRTVVRHQLRPWLNWAAISKSRSSTRRVRPRPTCST